MSIRYTKDGVQNSKTITQDRYRFAESDLLKKFYDIVSITNVRRLIFFDAVNSDTVLTDKSTNKQNATLSLSASSLDQSISGKLRVLNFNASSDYWEFADADDLSFGNGSVDSKFSIISCINPNNVTTKDIFSKYNITTAQVKTEYRFTFTSANKLQFLLYIPTSANTNISNLYNTALTGDIGSYHTYVATYDGSKVNTGIKLYRDGSIVSDTPNSGGTYSGMNNTTQVPGNYNINASGAKTAIGSYSASFFAVISDELSQTQITAIDTLLRRYVGVI